VSTCGVETHKGNWVLENVRDIGAAWFEHV
jgi:hypothetical protein